jgi:SAM-dependent methyltransferase
MTSVRGMPAPGHYCPPVYWEERARQFAAQREGLAAVCSYGMPEFYNRAIDLEQRLALGAWLKVREGTRVLDVGCGVGRWSRMLAARGARVLGIDLSPTMIAEARRRADLGGVGGRCRFAVADLSELELEERFELILGVTVLQHILDPGACRAALAAMAAHLGPRGRMVLLEAAPTARNGRCDSTVFTARRREEYLEMIARCGLDVRAIGGVDPAPFRRRLLPHVRKLSRVAGTSALAAATALSLPLNACFGRRSVKESWHAVFVLEPAGRAA